MTPPLFREFWGGTPLRTINQVNQCLLCLGNLSLRTGDKLWIELRCKLTNMKRPIKSVKGMSWASELKTLLLYYLYFYRDRNMHNSKLQDFKHANWHTNTQTHVHAHAHAHAHTRRHHTIPVLFHLLKLVSSPLGTQTSAKAMLFNEYLYLSS